MSGPDPSSPRQDSGRSDIRRDLFPCQTGSWGTGGGAWGSSRTGVSSRPSIPSTPHRDRPTRPSGAPSPCSALASSTRLAVLIRRLAGGVTGISPDCPEGTGEMNAERWSPWGRPKDDPLKPLSKLSRVSVE